MSTASPTSPPTNDPWFQDRFAERIGGAGYGKGTEVYKFELIKRAKRLALAEHPERKMLDFGIGENDEMAPESVRDIMKQEIDRPENRGYADNGILEFKEAVAAFMEREFRVVLDPTKEIKDDYEVDALAGATITGDGVTAMIKKDLRLYQPYFENLKKLASN